MRHLSLLFAFALAFGACAPSRGPVVDPAPVPSAERAAVAPEAEAPAADPVFDAAPENWWHLDAATDGVHGIGTERAYRELLAGRAPRRTVVVAIIDSGVDIEHEDLARVIWVNEGEIPGNGIDDDGNGYVDDVHGWNFIGGPDGSHVEKDTYEVTRLYAACQRGDAGAIDCDDVEAAFRAERLENARILEQVRMMDRTVDRLYSLLRDHLGVDSLTVENVSAIRTTNLELLRAQEVFLQLAAANITQDLIARELERLESLEDFGLNPDFDPRHIVGDDYENLDERFYGNADVRGPDSDHGTHVAGIVAAERGNGIGIDGIAPAVRIMAIRAVPDGDERDKDVANAIRYAVDNGAHIINMSFGKGFSPHKRAVDEAVRYADERGVLLVHAAGNDAADIDVEPNFPNRYYEDGGEARLWIEVGASSWQGPDRLAAPFTNYGATRVDVFAPGVDIFSTMPENEYRANSGTSMAAPVVSGLAALIMAYYPELDAADVRRVILESATPYADQAVALPGAPEVRGPFGALSATGGIVNAYAAIKMAEELAAQKR